MTSFSASESTLRFFSESLWWWCHNISSGCDSRGEGNRFYSLIDMWLAEWDCEEMWLITENTSTQKVVKSKKIKVAKTLAVAFKVRQICVCVYMTQGGCCPSQRWDHQCNFRAHGEVGLIWAFIYKVFETMATQVRRYHGESHRLHSTYRRDWARVHSIVSLTHPVPVTHTHILTNTGKCYG